MVGPKKRAVTKEAVKDNTRIMKTTKNGKNWSYADSKDVAGRNPDFGRIVDKKRTKEFVDPSMGYNRNNTSKVKPDKPRVGAAGKAATTTQKTKAKAMADSGVPKKNSGGKGAAPAPKGGKKNTSRIRDLFK